MTPRENAVEYAGYRDQGRDQETDRAAEPTAKDGAPPAIDTKTQNENEQCSSQPHNLPRRGHADAGTQGQPAKANRPV